MKQEKLTQSLRLQVQQHPRYQEFLNRHLRRCIAQLEYYQDKADAGQQPDMFPRKRGHPAALPASLSGVTDDELKKLNEALTKCVCGVHVDSVAFRSMAELLMEGFEDLQDCVDDFMNQLPGAASAARQRRSRDRTTSRDTVVRRKKSTNTPAAPESKTHLGYGEVDFSSTKPLDLVEAEVADMPNIGQNLRRAGRALKEATAKSINVFRPKLKIHNVRPWMMNA